MKMNKLITNISILFVTAFLLVGCSKEPSIVGKWEYKPVKCIMCAEFKEGGALVFTDSGKHSDGTWALSEDGKELTMNLAGNTDIFEVLEVTDEAMKIKQYKYDGAISTQYNMTRVK